MERFSIGESREINVMEIPPADSEQIYFLFFVMNVSDQKLLELCLKYGKQAILWKRKFAGLLPEVNRRKLYLKKDCGSIFEFSAKFCGMSYEQVARVLNLEQKFENLPVLKSALINGDISVNKLARVASVATQANEDFWVNQSKILSKSALETLVRDEKILQKQLFGGETQQINHRESNVQNGLFKPEKEQKSVPGHKNPQENIQIVNLQNSRQNVFQVVNGQNLNDSSLLISPEVYQKLLDLQQRGIDINQIVLDALANRELKIAQEKEQISQKQQEHGPAKRYISAKIKKIIKAEFGEKCSIKTCNKSAQQIHHTQRFALSQNHDPHFLAQLCKEHHVIAHSIDIKFQQRRRF